MSRLVSILIPAYNASATIGESIKSALAQTWPKKEIIVVDDGSRDNTASIARIFEGRGVTVVTQANGGAAAARNHAYSLCHGDYIQWLDADDLLSPEKIALQMACAEKKGDPRQLLSSPWGSFYYRPRKARFVSTALWANLAPVDWMICKFRTGMFMQTACWLTSRALCEAAGPWDTRLLGDDDGEYFSRVLLKSTGVQFIPEAKVYYRLPSPNSLSYIGSSDRKMEAHYLSMRLHIGRLRQLEESPRVRDAAVEYLQHWVRFFYPERPDLFAQACKLAEELGGKLSAPRLPLRYALLRAVFGSLTAKWSQLWISHQKRSMYRKWDRALYLLEATILQKKTSKRQILRTY